MDALGSCNNTEDNIILVSRIWNTYEKRYNTDNTFPGAVRMKNDTIHRSTVPPIRKIRTHIEYIVRKRQKTEKKTYSNVTYRKDVAWEKKELPTSCYYFYIIFEPKDGTNIRVYQVIASFGGKGVGKVTDSSILRDKTQMPVLYPGVFALFPGTLYRAQEPSEALTNAYSVSLMV